MIFMTLDSVSDIFSSIFCVHSAAATSYDNL